MIALAGEVRRWEPKRLRLQLFSIAGRLARGGRRLRLTTKKEKPRERGTPPTRRDSQPRSAPEITHQPNSSGQHVRDAKDRG
jgi:hypothetical protein